MEVDSGNTIGRLEICFRPWQHQAEASGSQPSQSEEEELSEYELQRMRNIRANQMKLTELGLDTPDGSAAAAPQGGGGGGKRRRTPSAGQASGPTAPSRRSGRDRGTAAPPYADHMNSDSDDADDDFDEGEDGVDDDE